MNIALKIETSKVVARKTSINTKKGTVTVVYADGTKETHEVPVLKTHVGDAKDVSFRRGARYVDKTGKAWFKVIYNDGKNAEVQYSIHTDDRPTKILSWGDGWVEVEYVSGSTHKIASPLLTNAETVAFISAGPYGMYVKIKHKDGTVQPKRTFGYFGTKQPVTTWIDPAVPVVPVAPAGPRARDFANDPAPADKLRLVALHPEIVRVEALADKDGWRVFSTSGPVIDIRTNGWRKEYHDSKYQGSMTPENPPIKYPYVVTDTSRSVDLIRVDAVDISKTFEQIECHLYDGVHTLGLDGVPVGPPVAVVGSPAYVPPPPSKYTTDVTDMRPWPIIEAVLPHTQRALLYGPPGTGKTHSATKEGLAREDQPVYAITLTDETPMTDLRGHFIMKDSKFVWMHGLGVRAWLEGARLVLNEIDHAGGDVMSFLHVMLDDIELASLTLPTGETVRPVEGYTVMATMNGEPHDLPFALRDRFPVQIHVNEVHPAAVAMLSEDLRIAAKNSALATDPQRRESIRRWAEFDSLRKGLAGHPQGKEIAAKACFGHRAQEVLDGLAIGATK